MLRPGEVRCYAGGRMLLRAGADGLIEPYWQRGTLVMKLRYNEKKNLKRSLDAAVELYGELEIVVTPDERETMDAETISWELELMEEEY